MLKEQQLAITATESETTRHHSNPIQHPTMMSCIFSKIELANEPKRNTTSYHQPVKKKRCRIAGSHETTVSSYWTSSNTMGMPFCYVSSQIFKHHE